MNAIFLFLIIFNFIFSNINNLEKLKRIIYDKYFNQDLKDFRSINSVLLDYLDSFPNFNQNNPSDQDLYNNCTNDGLLLENDEGMNNFLYLLSYSGNQLSDLGQEFSCLKKNFSYYLFSYNLILNEKEKNSDLFQFLEKNNFYTGICLFDNCNKLLQKLFNGYSDESISNLVVQQIINKNNIKETEKKDCENNLEACNYLPYYTLNKSGNFDESLTLKEKTKYNIFSVLIILTMIALIIEILVSLFIYCGYNLYNNSKNFTGELYEESDLDDDDEEDNLEEDPNEQILYSNSSSSKEKKYESCSQKFVKVLYKYFSFITKIIVLTMRKSKFYNNKNMEVITKIRIVILLLISFSTNFDVYIKIPSKRTYDYSFFRQFYFIFLKIASFGLDMFICLDGFEVMFKFMSYYKKNFFDKGNQTISFKGILKFYLFSIYKIIAYIILFFIVNYFNRYYVYLHSGGTLYTYYSNNINNNSNYFEIFNPKYTIFSYFFSDKIDDTFLTSYRISLLFINEFYAFTLLLIIFYIGNILKSKIYDYAFLIYIFLSFLLSYLLCSIGEKNETYTYSLISRRIILVKYPLILINHYFIGAITGLICYYMKDSTTSNSMMNEPDKCPFSFILETLEIFDFLLQKGKIIWTTISYFIQFLICMTFTILINMKSDNQDTLMTLSTSLKILVYYESGLFIFLFCFNTLFYFADDIEVNNYHNYNILNLIYQINFSFVNTIYLIIYSYYCYFGFHLKLNYQNLLLVSIGLFIFFCLENIIITILFIMPFKIVIKSLLDKYLVISSAPFSIEIIHDKVNENKINNSSGLSNEMENNYEEEDADIDKNESSK